MQKTRVAPGSIVRWKTGDEWILGKVKTIDRFFTEDGIDCVSLSVQFDERYCEQFPMGPHYDYVTYPTRCEVIFI